MADESSLERAVRAFECAWRAESPPDIRDIVEDGEANERTAVARELAAVDMELRWQAASQTQSPRDVLSGRPTWNDYARHVPEIGAAARLPAALIAEEYRVRQLWGDRPRHDRFISAYPDQLTQLPRQLARIDEELRVDGVAIVAAVTTAMSIPPAADPRAPLPWSDYLIQQHLGSGGFGKVYRALQKSLDRPVAVKALLKVRQQDREAVELFLQEARLLARLNHPGVVGVHGLGRFPGGGYFLVLDLIEGEDLQRRIDRGPLSIAEAVRIAIAVADAVQHAHEHGVLHGDLKPSNVLLNTSDAVALTDFGLGRLLPTSKNSKTVTQFAGGTFTYLAPELMQCGSVSFGSDIYSLGVLLSALLTGHPLSGHLPTNTPPNLPHVLSKLINACLRLEPTERPATARAIGDALRSLG